MCWIGTKETIVAMGETAVDDIVVYKIMRLNDGGLYSFTRNFAYVTGKECSHEGKICMRDDGDRHVSIERGFHSYSGDCFIFGTGRDLAVCEAKDGYEDKCYMVLNRYRGGGIVAAKCVIPKGSVYFRNIEGEFVSDRILVIDYCGLVGRINRNPMRFDGLFS